MPGHKFVKKEPNAELFEQHIDDNFTKTPNVREQLKDVIMDYLESTRDVPAGEIELLHALHRDPYNIVFSQEDFSGAIGDLLLLQETKDKNDYVEKIEIQGKFFGYQWRPQHVPDPINIDKKLTFKDLEVILIKHNADHEDVKNQLAHLSKDLLQIRGDLSMFIDKVSKLFLSGKN